MICRGRPEVLGLVEDNIGIRLGPRLSKNHHGCGGSSHELKEAFSSRL